MFMNNEPDQFPVYVLAQKTEKFLSYTVILPRSYLPENRRYSSQNRFIECTSYSRMLNWKYSTYLVMFTPKQNHCIEF